VLGEEGGGGIILNPEDKLEAKYAWGPGFKSKNITEALALQGLDQLLAQGITKANVFGVSQTLIGLLNSNQNSKNVSPDQVLRCLRMKGTKFKVLNYF